jgi:acetate kinase
VSILVLNCGSSSLKYRLVDIEAQTAVTSGLVERIGQPGSVGDHGDALAAVLEGLDAADVTAVAHRVVHGGSRFSEPVVVDDEVLAEIRALSALAPLHNPVNALGIEAARRALPALPHVAVFDTAFHQSLPPHSYTYAVPPEWATRYGARRYGFHGTSHAFVSRRAARLLDRAPADVNLIVLHLGNGASATAVERGRSVDTSMGLTPMEGLVMGTRCGDIDPALVFHLRRTAGLELDEIERVLNSGSGMKALAGASDLREVHARTAAGDAAAELALAVYCYRIRKYVGAYLAVLGHVDAVVFTAGVGENDPVVRAVRSTASSRWEYAWPRTEMSPPPPRRARSRPRAPPCRCSWCRRTRSWRWPSRRRSWSAGSRTPSRPPRRAGARASSSCCGRPAGGAARRRRGRRGPRRGG